MAAAVAAIACVHPADAGVIAAAIAAAVPRVHAAYARVGAAAADQDDDENDPQTVVVVPHCLSPRFFYCAIV